jgi:ribose transport system substrate-binding protein
MKKVLRFVMVPKVAHPWFDEVRRGALDQAGLLQDQVGLSIQIDYLPPAAADVARQAAILQMAIAMQPQGLMIDPVDTLDHLPEITRLRQQGVPVVFFDAPSPEAGIPGVGNDFAEQGAIAARRLVQLLNAQGKVAVMQGFPTAPNHQERFAAQVAILKRCPGITTVDGGVDNDAIETARQQAAAVLAAHPDLRGYLCCDASGPIGIAAAIREAGRIGKVKVVGMDAIRPILEAIKAGIIESSAATIPCMQGALSVLMLWQATLGGPLPRRIDTGIELVTRENVDAFLARA